MGQSDLPVANGAKHVAAFKRLGWTLDRVKGSHHILVKDRAATLSVPVHKGKDMGRGLLSKLLDAAGVSEQDYIDQF